MTALAFVDTNVVVYALGRDSEKRERARQILAQVPMISAQVVNETISLDSSVERSSAFEKPHE